MASYIPSEKLIEEAKNKGVDFGRGDPYNRLRYYTKMGWLPHMIRKKDEKEDVKGHYPAWALKRLLLIESLKAKGVSNEEINEKITAVNKWDTISTSLNLPKLKFKILVYAVLAIVILAIVSESGLFPIGESKKDLINQITNSATVK